MARMVPELDRVAGCGYYNGQRHHIYGARGSAAVQLVDGGAVDWTARLLSDARERLVISGLGSERVCDWHDAVEE